ncbi:unnamed protein product [Lampetra fluviatilis]
MGPTMSGGYGGRSCSSLSLSQGAPGHATWTAPQPGPSEAERRSSPRRPRARAARHATAQPHAFCSIIPRRETANKFSG